MTVKVNIDEIISTNPNVDKALFEKSRKQMKELRKIKTGRADYNIEPPFTRKVISPAEDFSEDPRAIYLRS